MKKYLPWVLAALALSGSAFTGVEARYAQAESARLQTERDAIADSLRMVGDSLALSRATQDSLKRIGDSLAVVARDRDARWWKAKLAGDSMRVAVLPDTGATREALRSVIAADVLEIAACGDAKATCEQRRETAESERDEAKRETGLVRDSTALVKADGDKRVAQEKLRTDAAKSDARQSKRVTLGAALVAILALVIR